MMRVERFGVAVALQRLGEARVLGELGPAHGLGQAAEQAVGHGRDVDVVAVARGVEIVGRALGEPRAGAVGDMAELLVGRDPRLHEVEGALVECRVDELPAPACAARHQRHDGAERARAGR